MQTPPFYAATHTNIPNSWLLDCARWSTYEVFTKWIQAIGDDNAARIKRFAVYNKNFLVGFTITKEAPRISFKLDHKNYGANPTYRLVSESGEISESVPISAAAATAYTNAEMHLTACISLLNNDIGTTKTTIEDIKDLFGMCELIKPTLCTTAGLGRLGASFKDPHKYHNFDRHIRECEACNPTLDIYPTFDTFANFRIANLANTLGQEKRQQDRDIYYGLAHRSTFARLG